MIDQNASKWFMIRKPHLLVAAFSVMLALGYLGFKNAWLEQNANWPKEGRELALAKMPLLMKSHDFHTDMDVWEMGENGETKYRYSLENEKCKEIYVPSGWIASDTAIPTFFRCDLIDKWADYSVTVLRRPYHSRFEVSGQYIIVPKELDKGPTKILICSYCQASRTFKSFTDRSWQGQLRRNHLPHHLYPHRHRADIAARYRSRCRSV